MPRVDIQPVNGCEKPHPYWRLEAVNQSSGLSQCMLIGLRRFGLKERRHRVVLTLIQVSLDQGQRLSSKSR
jgi:hypothetical protein